MRQRKGQVCILSILSCLFGFDCLIEDEEMKRRRRRRRRRREG
jgi:hypothetical protein